MCFLWKDGVFLFGSIRFSSFLFGGQPAVSVDYPAFFRFIWYLQVIKVYMIHRVFVLLNMFLLEICIKFSFHLPFVRW